MPSAERVWLITGCSTGFGRDLVRQLLGREKRIFVAPRRFRELLAFFIAESNGPKDAPQTAEEVSAQTNAEGYDGSGVARGAGS